MLDIMKGMSEHTCNILRFQETKLKDITAPVGYWLYHHARVGHEGGELLFSSHSVYRFYMPKPSLHIFKFKWQQQRGEYYICLTLIYLPYPSNLLALHGSIYRN